MRVADRSTDRRNRRGEETGPATFLIEPKPRTSTSWHREMLHSLWLTVCDAVGECSEAYIGDQT